MEEYSSEEVYSLVLPTSFRLFEEREGLLDFFSLRKKSSYYSGKDDFFLPTSVVFFLRLQREGLFVFFSNREDCFLEKANKSLLLHWNSSLLSERLFFSLSLSLEYIRSIYSFFLCSLYFFSRQTRESNSESSSSLLTAYVYRVYAAVVAIVVVCLRCKIRLQ